MKNIKVNNYLSEHYAGSPLNRLDDALDLLSLLVVPDVVSKLLYEAHRKPKSEAISLANRITRERQSAIFVET